MSDPIILSLDQLRSGQARAGAKASSLARLMRRGLPVPEGFAVLDPRAFIYAARAGRPELQPWLMALHHPGAQWIVRSSATAEDGLQASFAGQLESAAWLRGRDAVLEGVQRVSRPGARAASYARARDLAPLGPRIPVLVQRMVPVLRAGVLFTADPLGQRRGKFALDWSATPQGVTDGVTESNWLRFDPLGPQPPLPDAPMARALPELLRVAFEALDALPRLHALDLEWILDPQERLWLVQARPVTQQAAQPHPALARLEQEGWWRQSDKPASRFAQRSFQLAGRADRAAAPFHHGHFERRCEGPWLLATRHKRSKRQPVNADSAPAFLARWLWLRRGNLRFGLAQLPGWWRADLLGARRSERLLARDPTAWSDDALARRLAAALKEQARVRLLHAALWYPVDLVKDLADFAQLFGWPERVQEVCRPRRCARRDEDCAQLVTALRAAHGGAHPAWRALGAEEQQRVLRHLARHPYAFASSEEVQDIACWASHLERPAAWWALQAHLRTEELQASRGLRLVQEEAASDPPAPGYIGRLCGGALWWLVRRFAPLKDDRVELLALASAALRRVCLELERRASRGVRRGWIFELEPRELLRLARFLQDEELLLRLRSRAWARKRARMVEELAGAGEPARAVQEQVPPPGQALQGAALSAGRRRGAACVVRTPAEALRQLRQGEVLVTDEIRPSFSQAMPRAGALVCRRGSPLSHGAIVARELGIPAVALGEGVAALRSGQALEIDGDRGTVRLLEVA